MNTYYHKKSVIVFLFLICQFFLTNQFLSGQAKVWEGSIVIPTYGWADDINPKFWAMEPEGIWSNGRIPYVYPYSMQDHPSNKLKDVTYKAIFLENEYLKIICLPELGGRLHSVFNKSDNTEVFHRNNVIKVGRSAQRSGFLSGGVEWNAGPQGHTITLLSPVDVLKGQNDDGSAFIEISNLEKTLRTSWTVRITLHPGKSFMDEDIRLNNPTDAMNPYYFWNNTTFTQNKGTRFIYPMNLATDFETFTYFKWPLNKDGKDMSWLRNYVHFSSVFAYKCNYDFFGAYDVDLDRGVVQVANHNEDGGKKAWTWGQDEYAQTVQKNLTDKDGNYIEIQSGPMPTQLDWGLLAPGSSISWKEYWFPVHGLGDGFEYANEKVTFQTKFRQNNLEIKMIATEKFPDATCVIISDGKELQKKQVNLSPTSASTVIMDAVRGKPVTILLRTAAGMELARFEAPLPIPEVTPPVSPTYATKPVENLTAEELYLKGQKYDRSMNRTLARKFYEMALQKDSLHLASLRDISILDFEAGLYDKAAAGFTKALNQVLNDDGLAWYFLGLCYLKNGDLESAINSGFKAARCLGTGSLGYDLVGKVYMLENNYPEGLKYFLRAYGSNNYDSRIYHHYLLAKYANGEIQEARNLTNQRIKDYPTELVPRFLSGLMNNNLIEIMPEIRNFLGEDDFEIMEAGLAFSNVGLFKDAIKIFEAGCINGITAEKQNLLIQYQLGYLNSRIGDSEKARMYLEKASKNNCDLIWASRAEDEIALKYALSLNPKDAQAYYQLGNLFGNYGRMDEAAELWKKAVDVDQMKSIPWRNLGLYYWIKRKDHNQAELCFRNAIKARPEDQTLYRDLSKVLADEGKRKDAINLLEKMPPTESLRSDVIVCLAKFYFDEGRFDDCISTLNTDRYFVNPTGSFQPWNYFSKANIAKGILLYDKKNYQAALAAFDASLTFPGNLHTGRQEDTEDAISWFWKGKTYLALGKTLDAKNSWKTGSKLLKGTEEQNRYIDLCSSLAY